MKKYGLVRFLLASCLFYGILFQTIPVMSAAISPLFDLTLELDGIDDYASALDHPSLDLGVESDFTIESLVYVVEPERSDLDVLIWKEGAYGLSIIYGSGEIKDRIAFRINISAFDPKFVFYNLYLTEGWHHLAAVYDDEYIPGVDLLAIFLDGTCVATESDFNASMIPDTSSPISIGANAGANSVKGWLEEVRLSNSVRYAGSSYTQPDVPFLSDEHTRALWHFDEAWGNAIFPDATSNGNTLTGNNGAQIGSPTGIIPIALPFGKISPADQLSEASITTALMWDTSTGASGYQVCLETDLNDICDSGWYEVGPYTYYAPTLDAYTQYQWSVRSYNPVSTIYADQGQWWSFTTEDPVQASPDYWVTITTDENDGLCGIKHCTLREALSAAQVDGVNSTIVLQKGAGYTLKNWIPDDSWGSSAFPAITGSLSIFGDGATIERDPSLTCRLNGDEEPGEFRLFHVADTGKLSLHEVSLRYGCSDANPATHPDAGYGGAIFNRGQLLADHTTVANNWAYQGGGGIANALNASLDVTRSTIMKNFGVTEGGGLDNAGIASLTNSTVSGNLTAYTGGGMNNLGKGILNLNFVTITENDAGTAGGGLSNQAEGSLKLQNSILGGNIDIDFGTPNCAGSITSLGYNLVQNPEGCGYLLLESDILNEDPWLIPLIDAGYGSLSYALWVISPAIDHIPSGVNGCGTVITSDQRGFARPLDADLDGQVNCDIGAIEMHEGSTILHYTYFPIITK